MREIRQTSQFKKDLKKLAKSGKYTISELTEIIKTLAEDKSLPESAKDHPLSGKWNDHRDCHIRPDWILIYKLDPGRLILVRSGSHSELFK
jgi:mRNA interferase YafQ